MAPVPVEYVTVTEYRDRVPAHADTTTYPDEVVAAALTWATHVVHEYTGNLFAPYTGTGAVWVRADGWGWPTHQVAEVTGAAWQEGPDVAVEDVHPHNVAGMRPRVYVNTYTPNTGTGGRYRWNNLVVGAELENGGFPNLHGRGRRGAPAHEEAWLIIDGTFGPDDGEPVPGSVILAVVRLATGYVNQLTGPTGEGDPADPGSLRGLASLSTEGYSVSWIPGMSPGTEHPSETTGDPVVDGILAPYRITPGPRRRLA